MSNAVEYQSEIDVEGLHESWQTYPGHVNRFMDLLRDAGIHTFRFGFAWQNDESSLRHMSAYLNPLPESFFRAYEEGGTEAQLPNDHPIHFANYPEDRRPYITPNNGCSASVFLSNDNVPTINIEGRYSGHLSTWCGWLHSAFKDFAADIDCLWELNVPKRTVDDIDVLYITDPILESQVGENVEWNM
jgi:hypothetical protein